MIENVLTIAKCLKLLSNIKFFEILHHCVLVNELIISIDYFSRTVLLIEKRLPFQLLKETYQVLESIALVFFQLNLDWCSSTDIQIKDGILKVNHLICYCLRDLCEILWQYIIFRSIKVIVLAFEYYVTAL